MSPVQSMTVGAGQDALAPVHVSASVDCAGLPATQLAARQETLLAANESPGHTELAPVQVSTTSHTPALPRHTVLLGANASAGQAALAPVQFSAASHTVTAARQTVAPDANASAGQVVLAPVHASATSQAPALPRHTVPALPAGCWQLSLAPLH
jgi:hypothetical protein